MLTRTRVTGLNMTKLSHRRTVEANEVFCQRCRGDLPSFAFPQGLEVSYFYLCQEQIGEGHTGLKRDSQQGLERRTAERTHESKAERHGWLLGTGEENRQRALSVPLRQSVPLTLSEVKPVGEKERTCLCWVTVEGCSETLTPQDVGDIRQYAEQTLHDRALLTWERHSRGKETSEEPA